MLLARNLEGWVASLEIYKDGCPCITSNVKLMRKICSYKRVYQGPCFESVCLKSIAHTPGKKLKFQPTGVWLFKHINIFSRANSTFWPVSLCVVLLNSALINGNICFPENSNILKNNKNFMAITNEHYSTIYKPFKVHEYVNMLADLWPSERTPTAVFSQWLVKYVKNLPSGNNLIALLASCKTTFHKREYEH